MGVCRLLQLAHTAALHPFGSYTFNIRLLDPAKTTHILSDGNSDTDKQRIAVLTHTHKHTSTHSHGHTHTDQLTRTHLALARVAVSCRSPGSNSCVPFRPSSSQPLRNSVRLSWAEVKPEHYPQCPTGTLSLALSLTHTHAHTHTHTRIYEALSCLASNTLGTRA